MKKSLAALALLLATYASAQEISFPFSSLELGLTNTKEIRTRAVNRISYTKNNLQITYHGLNEINNLNKASYAGRNRLIIGKPNANNQPIIDATYNQKHDVKLGIRNTSIPRKLNGTGFIDLETNLKGSTIVASYSKNIADKWNTEATALLSRQNKETKNYLEVQLNYKLKEPFYIYTRAEFTKHNQTYIIGINIMR